MHHYTAFTAVTITEATEHHGIWQILIPRLAFSHTYLLNGLLSLTALHCHYDEAKPEEDRRALIKVAREYQQVALSMYITELERMTEPNSSSLFAYSIILGGICYAFISETQDDTQPDDIITMIIAAFDTLIGATAVAILGRDWLRKGPLSPLMIPFLTYDECMTRLSHSSKSVIEYLLDSVPPAGAVITGAEEALSEETHETYITAIQALAVAFPQADGSLSSLSEVISWPVVAGKAYLALIKEQDDFALLILAYYGVALHYSDRIWFLKGTGTRLVHAIAEKLSAPSWLPHMDRCLQFYRGHEHLTMTDGD